MQTDRGDKMQLAEEGCACMAIQDPTLAEFAPEWEKYQGLLIKALAPLAPEQLDLRAAPNLRSIGEIAQHIVGARARWLHMDLNEGGSELDEFAKWDRRGMPARTAAELVGALERTWQVLRSGLGRWTEADLAHTFEGEEDGKPCAFTRRWVIWHLIEHDIHHGGEISFLLGMHGLPAPDL
jgi:uncharacterized damage-inducible protein DinB